MVLAENITMNGIGTVILPDEKGVELYGRSAHFPSGKPKNFVVK
jgi:hypothetical protein